MSYTLHSKSNDTTVSVGFMNREINQVIKLVRSFKKNFSLKYFQKKPNQNPFCRASPGSTGKAGKGTALGLAQVPAVSCVTEQDKSFTCNK